MLIVALVVLGAANQHYRPVSVVESTVQVASAGHRWQFQISAERIGKQNFARWVRASCDGKDLWSEDMLGEKRANLPHGNYVKIAKVDVRSKYPVIATRGHTGMGEHTDTLFYSLVGKRMILAGRPPAKNSFGPINYKGKRDEWLFDNYDWYNQGAPLRYVLYRLDANYKLQEVRSWKVYGKTLPDTVKLWF